MSTTRFSKSEIDRLDEFLSKAMLTETDRKFARIVVRKFATAGKDDISRRAYAGFTKLLAQDAVSRAKTARRFAVRKVDIFNENLDRFSRREMAAIAKSCHLIQLTDGCTVACAWCYLNAQPYVRYGITYESIRRFLVRYGKLLPSPVRFYWASDPLDWYDGENSYVDLVSQFHTITGGKTDIVTTTSLPAGAEITFLRLVDWLDTNLPFQKSGTFGGDTQHYQKNDVMKALYYQKDRPLDINTLFDYHIKNLFYYRNIPHVLKISETDANYIRLRTIFDVLKFMGISESCLSWIEVETRDVGGDTQNIRKSGRAYAWKNRDTVVDTVSMACWDSTILFPGKVGAMEMCGVTPGTQRGLEFWLLERGRQTIPEERAIVHYAYYTDGRKKKTYLLPYLTMTEYENGRILRRFTHYSLKRDIQAYGLLLSKTIPTVEFTAAKTHIPLTGYAPWQAIRKEYRKRRDASDRLLKGEKDQEVIRLVGYLTSRLDEKLAA